MIPSTEAAAENIRKHIEGMSGEIARRVAKSVREGEHVHGYSTIEEKIGLLVRVHARAVLLDWFLGDYLPGAENAKAE